MIIHLLFFFSTSTKSPISLEIGKNAVSISVNQPITIRDINPQTFFLFPQPIPNDLEITAECNGKTIGTINDENIGFHFGTDSGSISFRHSGQKSFTSTLTFYFLTPTRDAVKYFLSTYQEDAFVLSQKSSFSSCRIYKEDNPIVYWHVTGTPQKLVSSSINEDPENTVLYGYDKIIEKKISAKSTDPVTLSSSELIYFLWNSETNSKKGTYKIVIQPDSNDLPIKPSTIPELRYAFNKRSKTSLLAKNHNYGDYEKLKKAGKPLPLKAILNDRNELNQNNVIEFSFDSSAIIILLTLIGIIVVLLAILIYVGLMPVPKSSTILNQKHHNDEESLLKDNEKSPELAAYLRSKA